MNPPGAPTKAADPLGAARYAMPKRAKQNAANIFLKARAAMYGVAPPYNPWHDPAFTGENEFANVENVAPVNLTGAIGVGNAPAKRPTQSIFGNVGRLPGEPPAAPKKSLRRRRHRRAAATRRR
jgi:hypothetical protein